MLIGLIGNIGLLLALTILYDLLLRYPAARTNPLQLVLGVNIGLIGIAVMLTHWELMPGLVFDVRSVLLSLSGLFFGPWPTAVAVLMTGSLRWYQGGAGAPVGIAVIVTSAVIGLLWRRLWFDHGRTMGWLELGMFGLVVHLAMLAWMLALPDGLGRSVIDTIAVPVLLLFPATTVLIGLALNYLYQRWQTRNLTQTLVDNVPDLVFRVDPQLRVAYANPALTRLLGQPRWYRRALAELGLSKELVEHCARRLRQPSSPHALDQLRFAYRDTGGETRWFEALTRPERSIEGRLQSLLVVGRDVTAWMRAEAALREANLRLEQAQRMARLGSWERDLVADTLIWSDETLRIFGLNGRRSPSFQDFMQRVHPDDRARLTQAQQRLFAGTERIDIEYRITRPDGTQRWLHEQGESIADHRGQVVRVMGVVQDITATRRADEELRIAAVAFEAQQGLIVTDAQGRILRVNRKFTRVTGYRAEEVIGKTPALLKSGRQDALFYRRMWSTLEQIGYWEGEIWNRRRDGSLYPQWLGISAVTDATGRITHYVGAFNDISERKQAEEHIHQLAYYDQLTRLPNRQLLRETLEQRLVNGHEQGCYGALLFIDLDRFRNLNDTEGHEAGDQLLCQVARRLERAASEQGRVTRYGGDEFVVLTNRPVADQQQAAALALQLGERLLQVIEQPYQLNHADARGAFDHHLGASIGIVLFGEPGDVVDELLRRAEAAMYQAKAAGRGRLLFYDPVTQAVLEQRLALENSLRQALQRNQFEVYYQPQVDRFRRPVGAELLIRWHHPERGLIAPADFIPLAEDTGLIIPLGDWVLETACRQLREWSCDPVKRRLTLAVNVSARQFREPNFVTRVSTTLATFGVDPWRLKLELTESLLLDNVDATIEKMAMLQQSGVGFSLDDFGTGYSSLAYLKRLPLKELKIDKTFVRDLATDAGETTIVRTVIAMAQQLGLEVVAEGVETSEQQTVLHRLGCVTFQGYGIARPMPVAAFEQWLDDAARAAEIDTV